MSKLCLATTVLALLLQWRNGKCVTDTKYLYGPNGNITTPGYPNGYPRQSSFHWYIIAGEEQMISLEIKDLDLQSCNSSICSDGCDVLDIHVGDSIWRFCENTSTTKMITSRGNRMTIAFHSGNTRNGSRGIWLKYQTLFIDKPTNIVTEEWRQKIEKPPGKQVTTQRTVKTNRYNRTPKPQSSIIGTALISSIVAMVVLAVLVLCGYGMRKRLSKLARCLSSHQQNCHDDHPSSFTTPPDLTMSDEEFQRRYAPPPSYEEATRRSQSIIDIPSLSLEANSEDSTAYDSTGLPSYNEALRISQMSLNET